MSLQLQKSYHQVFNVFQDDIVSFFWGAERTKVCTQLDGETVF